MSVRALHKVVLTVSLIRNSRPYGFTRRAGHLNDLVCPVVVSVVVVGVEYPCGVSRMRPSFLKPCVQLVFCFVCEERMAATRDERL